MSDPFDGTWSINLDESLVWDAAARKYVSDEVGYEVITIQITGNVQDYEVLYGDGPRFRMGYTTPYDSPDWADYSVREILTSSDDPQAEIAAFKERIKAGGEGDRQLELGKPYGLVRLVYIDERTHYRVSRNPVGKGPSILLRRMADDRISYITHLMDVTGTVFRIRKFNRVA